MVLRRLLAHLIYHQKNGCMRTIVCPSYRGFWTSIAIMYRKVVIKIEVILSDWQMTAARFGESSIKFFEMSNGDYFVYAPSDRAFRRQYARHAQQKIRRSYFGLNKDVRKYSWLYHPIDFCRSLVDPLTSVVKVRFRLCASVFSNLFQYLFFFWGVVRLSNQAPSVMLLLLNGCG